MEINKNTDAVRKVEHPPIIEASVLIAVEKDFPETYTEILQRKLSPDFVIEENNPLKKISDGYIIAVFNNAQTRQEVILAKDYIIYREGKRYKDLPTLVTNLKALWDTIGFGEYINEIEMLRFRVINKFTILISDLGRNFTFYPVIQEREPNELVFGYSAIETKLRSEFRAAYADVRAQILPIEGENLEITFDIDTFIEKEPLLNFSSVEQCLKRLSELKNDIFFANIPDAKERFKNV
jgi:hypothetical protein